MTTVTTAPPTDVQAGSPAPGPLARLGLLTATRRRSVFIAWALLVVALGAFAPRVESALAGAGWEASGSPSVQTRDVVQREFAGLSSAALMVVLHREDGPVLEGPGAAAVQKATALLDADPRVSTVVPPQPGLSVSQDGRTAIVQGGAGTASTNELVRAADDLKGPLGMNQLLYVGAGACPASVLVDRARRTSLTDPAEEDTCSSTTTR